MISAEFEGLKPGMHTLNIHKYGHVQLGLHKVGPVHNSICQLKAGNDGIAKLEPKELDFELWTIIGKSMVIGNNIAGGMIVHSGPHPKPAYAGCGLSPQQGSKVKGVVKFIQ